MPYEILQVFLHVSHISYMDKEDLFYINFDQIPGVEEKKKARKLGSVYYVCVYNRTLQKLLFNKLDIVPVIQSI